MSVPEPLLWALVTYGRTMGTQGASVLLEMGSEDCYYELHRDESLPERLSLDEMVWLAGC